jgi:hypothetical protein
MQYVGETKREVKIRIRDHVNSIEKPEEATCRILANHFNNPCCNQGFTAQIIEKIEDVDNDPDNNSITRKKNEDYWIKELRTRYPYGLNATMDQEKDDRSKFGCFNRRDQTTKPSQRRRKPKTKRFYKAKDLLDGWKNIYGINPRHARKVAFRKTLQLPKKILKDLDIMLNEATTDHCLDDMVLDLVTYKLEEPILKKKKEFTSRMIIHYSNKIMETINLSRILNNGEVKGKWPNNVHIRYMIPAITFTYDNQIGSRFFNYRQCLEEWKMDLFLQDLHDQIQCGCTNSTFCDPHHGHIMTGDLRIIDNPKVRRIMELGPKFREPQSLDRQKCRNDVEEAVEEYTNKIAEKSKITASTFKEWKELFMKKYDDAMRTTNTTCLQQPDESLILRRA